MKSFPPPPPRVYGQRRPTSQPTASQPPLQAPGQQHQEATKTEVKMAAGRAGGEKSRLRIDWMSPEWTGNLVAGQMTHGTTGQQEQYTLAWR